MKQIKTKFIILLLSISLYSCKKYHFNTSNITETDIMGNLVGNKNPNDWKLYKLYQATSFDKNVFNELNRLSIFNTNLYNSCDSNYIFDLIAYPNPMINDCNLQFNLSTNINFIKSLQIIVSKDGKFIESGTNYPGYFPDYKINALKKRDFIFYYIFVTADSCMYYGKGNVIGCTN